MDFPDLKGLPHVWFDTETTGLHYPSDCAFGLSVAVEGAGWYWDLREHRGAINWLQDVINSGSRMVGFNTSFDVRMLAPLGVVFDLDNLDDVAIRACLIDEHLSTVFPWPQRRVGYNLDDLARKYLGDTKESDIYEELASEFGGLATRKVQMPNLQRAAPSLVAPYAIKDAILTRDLWLWQQDEIDHQGIHEICEFERRLLKSVVRKELRGVRVDVEAAKAAQFSLTTEIEAAQGALDSTVGKSFNVNSTPQIREYFQPEETENGWWLPKYGIPCNVTAKGNASIDKTVLQELSEVDPVARLITDIRSLLRTKDTFLGKHIIGHAYDGRVYPNINQVAGDEGGTKTGRFSYTDPALQQIPSRNKVVAEVVKRCFLPEEGHVWVDADLASFEVRIFAHLVALFNDALVRVYAEDANTDFHQFVADLMGIPRNPSLEGGQANAKQINLSMIFNSGRGAIANKIGLPCTPSTFTDKWTGKEVPYFKAGAEANRLIDKYHSRVKGVQTLAEKCKRTAERRGFIFTEFGRRLRFPRGYKSYKASGLLIQATAADINKQNWLLIDEALDGRGTLLLNTHDSYSMSMPEEVFEETWRDVRGVVEGHSLRVPLVLDLNGKGATWWDAVK